MIAVKISRTNGPDTDLCVEADFDEADLDTIKNVLGMVNAVAQGERWYLQVDDEDHLIIPHCDVSDPTIRAVAGPANDPPSEDERN